MTRLLGYDALAVALAVALFGVLAAAFAARRGEAALGALVRGSVFTLFGLTSAAVLAMVYALVSHDFSISYVAQVGSRSTPLFFTIISLWGALEGSILFWAWVLSLWAALVVWRNREVPGRLIPYTGIALLGVSAFFLILLVGPANPFGLVTPVPSDGPGPNPLLQNHVLMAVHPPLLYLGYVGMSVPFAFAIAALVAGEAGNDTWLRLTRRWTLLAWGFLSAAIIAGMWWSYEVLGWGGYWAWDPVENASFLPWLTATAFLHSVMVQERRGMLRLWNVNLIVSTYALTILGTFLTRSGVLSSVHAFTTGTIGYYFLAFIAVVLIVSLVLVAGHSEELRGQGRLDAPIARETVFLLNNLFLTAFMFTVLLGTLFPLVAEAVRGVKVSVGEPFYNRMTLPLCAALLFLMGVGPALPWRRSDLAQARAKLMMPGIVALVVAVLSAILLTRNAYAVAAFAFATFAIVCNVREYWLGAAARRRAHGEAPATALVNLIAANRRRYGGYLAHIGVVAVALGVAASSAFRKEHDATLKRGEKMSVAGFELQLDSLWGREEPQRAVIGATMRVMRDGREVGRLTPRMNFYRTQDQPVPTPAVRSRPWGDLYLNLMAFEPNGSSATIRAITEPLVPWIWIGGGIICLGALVALSGPARKRVAVRETSDPEREPPSSLPLPELEPARTA
ncbi:MAG TPA: heme lyase CcmF/NrfE family subunit [Gemmatimonadaceae bacterium]|nr:heme lyase CcmF/NrfE family subunit [Gemmatimonadaceae bacterium]